MRSVGVLNIPLLDAICSLLPLVISVQLLRRLQSSGSWSACRLIASSLRMKFWQAGNIGEAHSSLFVSVSSAPWRQRRRSMTASSTDSSSAQCTFLTPHLWVESWPASQETWMKVRMGFLTTVETWFNYCGPKENIIFNHQQLKRLHRIFRIISRTNQKMRSEEEKKNHR